MYKEHIIFPRRPSLQHFYPPSSEKPSLLWLDRSDRPEQEPPTMEGQLKISLMLSSYSASVENIMYLSFLQFNLYKRVVGLPYRCLFCLEEVKTASPVPTVCRFSFQPGNSGGFTGLHDTWLDTWNHPYFWHFIWLDLHQTPTQPKHRKRQESWSSVWRRFVTLWRIINNLTVLCIDKPAVLFVVLKSWKDFWLRLFLSVRSLFRCAEDKLSFGIFSNFFRVESLSRYQRPVVTWRGLSLDAVSLLVV